MKKIKKIKKLLISLTLLIPLYGIGFNNQYQNTKKVITENSNNSLNNYIASQTNAQREMGDITVNVEGTTITGYVSGTGDLVVDSNITTIDIASFQNKQSITSLDLSNATSLTNIRSSAFEECYNLTGDLVIPSSVETIGNLAFSSVNLDNLYFLSETPPTSFGSIWRPAITGKVYVPQGTTNTYLDDPMFGFDSSQVTEWSFDSSSANINGNFNQIDISTTDIGSSSSEFSISGCSPETLSQNAFIWSLIPTGKTQAIPNGLWISKGKINWKNVAQGTYTFKIQSSFDQWSKQSDQTITINVTGDTPVPPEPTPEKSSIPLILGLLIGLGIPVILAIAFVVWYLTRKKKTTVKI